MTDDDTGQPHLQLEQLAAQHGIDAVAHSMRWRKVANGYPRVVALAYDGDTAAALAHTDAQVALHVAAWEQANGMTPRDWQAIGDAEHGDDAYLADDGS